MTRRTGRRPGKSDTRESILTAARAIFADRGFDGASIRAIATGAGVDPALVHHYFGSKDQLFLAVMNVPVDPRELLPTVFAEGPDAIGERMVRTLLRVWDAPSGAVAIALMRSGMTNEWSARMLREFLVTQVLRRVMQHLEVDPAEMPLRGGLVATQLAGLAMMRHVIKLEPVASAPAETLVAAIGPTVQRYLTGELNGALAQPT